jgi:thiol-disulfide isomerase/thioredoxin
MNTVAAISRLVLALVFVVAAAAKLADRDGTREAVIAFGGPVRGAGALAVALPIVELVTAGLLLPAGTAVVGAIAALALLAGFSILIAANLMRGRAPDCHCFGQLHSAPTGPWTLARNGALTALAASVLVAGGGPIMPAWAWGAAGGVVAVALVCSGMLMSLRAYGRLLLRIDRLERALADAGIDADEIAVLDVIPPQIGLAPGTPAPAFDVTDVAGDRVTLADLLAPGRAVMLVFASPGCGPCSALMPSLAEWQRDHGDRLTIAVASDGLADDVRAKGEEVGLERVLVDENGRLYTLFEAGGTPSGVLIDSDGTITSRVASGADEIEALVRHVIDAPGVPVGTPVPALELTAIDGETIALGAPSQWGTLLLFWNPDCGYCRRIHEAVRAWEETGERERPQLLVVSSGDADHSREDGFRSAVVLDPDFSVAATFGASGTPSAILLDESGHVASRVAVGSPAVLALTGADEAVMTR